MSYVLTGDLTTDTAFVGRTPHGHGLIMNVRPNTSDWNTVNACAIGNDEYSLPVDLEGWALDIGAHIGAASIPLLLDNPGLQLIAVEALPENVLLLNQNAILNNVQDRIVIVHGAASDTHDKVLVGYGGDAQHHFIGGSDDGNVTAGGERQAILLPGITLGAVMALRPIPVAPFVWTKIDCEGCEYAFLKSAHITSLQFITGEVHRGWQRLVDLLQATHTITGPGTDFGPFQAVLK